MTAPSPESLGRILLTNGIVHTPNDPGATSLLVEGSEIGWIGHAGAALAHADGVDRVIDVAGALITPAFVDAAVPKASTSMERWWKVGVVATLVATAGAGAKARAGTTSPDDRNTQVITSDPSEAELSEMVRLGVTAIVEPRNRAVNLAALAAAGVPLAFGSGSGISDKSRAEKPDGDPANPWGTVFAAMTGSVVATVATVATAKSALPARAAFNAHTRGGWRALGHQDAGVLLPGAKAHLAVWKCEELTLQEPDDRVSRWSTDPRSGTPLLPALSPDMVVPECVLTMADGVVLFEDLAALDALGTGEPS